MKIKTRMLDGTIRIIDTDKTYDIETLCGREQLEHQLAEKDKEIEEYKQQCYDCKHLHKKLELNIKNKLINDIENLRAEKRDYERIIRHQVCEEIKNLASNYFDMPICENCGEQIVLNDVVLTGNDLIEILNQIEKGEE